MNKSEFDLILMHIDETLIVEDLSDPKIDTPARLFRVQANPNKSSDFLFLICFKVRAAIKFEWVISSFNRGTYSCRNH